MNEQKAGLPENELEQVSGGLTLPDTDENKRTWEKVIFDLQMVLRRYRGEEGGMDRLMQRKLNDAYNLSGRCLHELNINGDLLPAAMDLYHTLTELAGYPDIEEQRTRLRALL